MNTLSNTAVTRRNVRSSPRHGPGSSFRLSPVPAVPGAGDGPAELSFSQQRLWFLDQMDPGRATYVIPMAIELHGTLDVPLLERTLAALVRRHESLRTVFAIVEERPLQIITPPGVWQLPVINLSDDPQARGRLDELLRQESLRGFDLARGPLFRARLYRLEAGRWILFVAMHHIISDGWSLGILLRELGELYSGSSRGEPAILPALRYQYRDFAHWQRDRLQGGTVDQLLKHWRSVLTGAPQTLELPADRIRPAVESNRGASYSFALPAELAGALPRFAREEGVTLHMTLLAAFAALLGRYSSQEDLLVGTPVANRNRLEFESVVGCFTNTLALRARLSGNPTVREFLGRMRDVCLDAMDHQDLPFERLVEELRPAQDLSRSPLVQVMFALEDIPLRPPVLPGLESRRFELERVVSHVDLTLRVREAGTGFSAQFEYATDLFDPATIARMAGHWCSLLQGMVASPAGRVAELPVLGGAERIRLLMDWNSTAAGYPRQAGVHELFEAQAERTPAAGAVTFDQQHLTYQELNLRAGQITRRLLDLGAGPGARVGLCLERSLDMLAALLGILKAGAAYVPLDPSFPPERLRFIVDDARLALLVSTADLADRFGLPRERQILLDADARAIAPAAPGRLPAPPPGARGADPAYVIYTSGSTGKPKGVVVPHQAVVNFLTSMAREPGLAAGDVLLAVTSLSFDIAVLELLLPLTVGARIVIASHEQTMDGHALAALLERHQATVMQATPVTWRLLLEADWTPKRAFKALVGGETLPKSLAGQLIAREIELWNMYGPTETTVWSTCARITDPAAPITIGRPIANTVIRILDARGNLCPVGVPGELCIGGDGVSLSYWHQPELTAERYITDPFAPAPAARLYRTGDRARWREDGTLEHLGRLDCQVKLRGFRIELGEIEAVMARHPSVREVAVFVREDIPGDKHLAACIVAANPPAGLVEALRAHLRAALPEYMVPAHFVMLKTLPRTPNGKLDRNSLPALAQNDAPRRRAAAPPRTPTEEMLIEAFRNVLERTDFGVTDSFFDLGGHSLMAARLMLKVRAASGLDAPMRLLFERPTVARLAEVVDGLSWLEASKTPGGRAGAGSREEIEL